MEMENRCRLAAWLDGRGQVAVVSSSSLRAARSMSWAIRATSFWASSQLPSSTASRMLGKWPAPGPPQAYPHQQNMSVIKARVESARGGWTRDWRQKRRGQSRGTRGGVGKPED